MANYKIVDSDLLDSAMYYVANKIREVADLSDQLPFPEGFVEGIDLCNSLNFSVVGGTTQPSNPKENTIWVNTGVSISGWLFHGFSSLPTDGVPEGFVAIRARFGDSDKAFNALKKNFMMFSCSSVEQLVSGVWVDVNAEIYANGAWNDLVSYLFNYGNQEYAWEAIGMKAGNYSNQEAVAPTVTDNADGSVTLSMPASTSSKQKRGGYICRNVDLTNVSQLVLKCSLNPSGGFEFGLHVLSPNTTYYNDCVSKHITNQTDGPLDEYVVPVSSLNGMYDIFIATFTAANTTFSATIKEVIAQ